MMHWHLWNTHFIYPQKSIDYTGWHWLSRNRVGLTMNFNFSYSIILPVFPQGAPKLASTSPRPPMSPCKVWCHSSSQYTQGSLFYWILSLAIMLGKNHCVHAPWPPGPWPLGYFLITIDLNKNIEVQIHLKICPFFVELTNLLYWMALNHFNTSTIFT